MSSPWTPGCIVTVDDEIEKEGERERYRGKDGDHTATGRYVELTPEQR